MKYSQLVMGLMLVSPLHKAPSWIEWLYRLKQVVQVKKPAIYRVRSKTKP
ncbi:hypothetical protein CDL12_14369 [Handroanthus impetiginosus]|uniref:Uncharacterized protein n=1 Tax=Handroanthus impetiginosus TaxID=429701 RepID=A0A2G9H6S4_9LAMI|nr:hypothetical protein CDL12_14369 [Handroanthus impetiginosus]